MNGSALLDLAGGVALLLWGLHMVHSGVLRAFGADIRRFLGAALSNRFKAFLAGVAVTSVLQSSTATALMVSTFAAEGVVGLVAALALLLGATTLFDRGALAHSMLVGPPGGRAERDESGMLAAMLVAIGLYIPVMMMYWFSPVLVAWHGISAAKALFFSFMACLLNWRAFLAYGAVTLLMTVVAPSLAISAVLVAAGGAQTARLEAFVYALFLVMLPTLVASFYVSYRDVFGTPETA